MRPLRHLGPSFRVLYSECVRDAGGNRERIAFVYDTRMVEFTGMASHLHPPREKESTEYLSQVSWWRPPYVASFRSGKVPPVPVLPRAQNRRSPPVTWRRRRMSTRRPHQ